MSQSSVLRTDAWLEPPFDALVKAVNAAVFIIQGTKYRYANPVAERLTGHSVARLQSMDFLEIVHPDEQEAVRESGLARQNGLDMPDEYPIRILHKSGTVHQVMFSASLIELDNRLAVLGVVQDVSMHAIRQERMDDQLLQAQKMEAIGTLVGGIAHDFNNILAGITGNVFLARNCAGDGEKVVARMDRIDKLSFRAAGMIKQLLAFARKDMVDMQAFAFAPFLHDIIQHVRVEIGDEIDFQTDIDIPDVIRVNGDTAQLQQVLLHLIHNAFDAVAECKAPQVDISAHLFEADDAFVQAHEGLGGRDMICIGIRDNGCGISGEFMNHIFEPFFSTKAVGKGSGLGLSMVYGAVQTHAGAIEVESQAGEGSCFSIYFPLHGLCAASGKDDDIQLHSGHGECILLVDDDASVLSTGSEVLRSLGYRVLMAASGREALDMYGEHGEEIDLVVLDVVMPGMGGQDVALALQEIQADVNLMFATGYDQSGAFKRLRGMDANDVLLKPFSIAELSLALRRKLGT
ncbi:MAG: ATP-binding protein [Mariprofundaceae bacterium]|nr:ATP-binding protein [Mariprofundaceae bacterium]